MITRGLGGNNLLVRGLGIIEEIIRGGFGWYYPTPVPVAHRSKSATLFINKLKEKIMETGIVQNTQKDYNPRTNRRYQVSERRAARIAYNIAKREGYHVGKYRGPNK